MARSSAGATEQEAMSYFAILDWPSLGVFTLQLLVMTLLVLCLCGHFPIAGQQPKFKALPGRLLLAASALSCAGSIVVAVAFARRQLPIPVAVIAAGIALLSAPLLLQRLPDRFVDGRRGLAILGGVTGAMAYVIGRAGFGP